MKRLKSKKTMLLLAAILIGSLSIGGMRYASATPQLVNASVATLGKSVSIYELTNDTRVFKVDPSIKVQAVRFQNRYGIEVAGHLYLPKDFDANKKYAAIVLSGPFGAVKEQTSGLYAQEMAKRGFVTVAFDPSFTGESGGNVRNVGSPEINTEDFSAAVDFVGLLDYVNRDRIGGIGICGLSGPVITAATNDIRIKAVATSAMYDMSRSMRDGYENYYTPKMREKVKAYLADMRWKEAEKGSSIPGLHEVPFDSNGNPIYAASIFPEKLPADANEVWKSFFEYYRGRAYHERAINSTTAWSSTTPYGFFNFPLTTNVKEISPRPIMLITGDKAHSRYYSEDVYKAAKSPKELVVVRGANHTDLYDQMDKIPFDKLEKFFDNALLK